jgi:hypothetical protein
VITTRVGLLGLVGALSIIASVPRQAPQSPSRRPVRVLLGSVPNEAVLPVAGPWRLVDAGGRVIVRGDSTRRWSVHRDGRRVRAVHADAPASPWVDRSLTFELVGGADVTWQQKTYRGVLTFVAGDSALLIVNRVDVEEYLRGVVPLEIGGRLASDHAAVEAQAVAARSFTYTRMLASGSRDFDLRATDADQVYGGTSAETFWGDLAVAATAGWVLSHRGQVVNAALPLHLRWRDRGAKRGVARRTGWIPPVSQRHVASYGPAVVRPVGPRAVGAPPLGD